MSDRLVQFNEIEWVNPSNVVTVRTYWTGRYYCIELRFVDGRVTAENYKLKSERDDVLARLMA